MATDGSDLSLSLTMTSSGTTNVAVVGGDGGASSGAAVDAVQISSSSDTDMQIMRRPPAAQGRRNRSSSRTSARGVRRSSKTHAAPLVARKPSTDRMQTQIGMLEHELGEARRMQNLSERQVAHVAHVARAEQVRAQDMHAEAKHYATEAMQHHRSAVYRAHQTAQVSATMTQTVDKLKEADRNAQMRVTQLELELTSSNARRAQCAEEVAVAQNKYQNVSSSLSISTTADAHKGAELQAQTELVEALRYESRDRLAEINSLGGWLRDYQSMFMATAHAEEHYAAKMFEAEHQYDIESSIAASARDSVFEWASQYGSMKQEADTCKAECTNYAETAHESRLALLNERNAQLSAMNAHENVNVINEEYQQAIVTVETVARQRDALDERQANLHAKCSEMDTRCSELQSSLARAYNLNSQLQIRLENAIPDYHSDDGSAAAIGIGSAPGTNANNAHGVGSTSGTNAQRTLTKDMLFMKKITEWKPTVAANAAKPVDQGANDKSQATPR